MSKTKEKLIDAAIEYLNIEDVEKISVKKLIKIADVGYGTFYNHFNSIEDIQVEALNKTVRNVLIEFKLDVKNEKDYVYIIYLALLRGINLLVNCSIFSSAKENNESLTPVVMAVIVPPIALATNSSSPSKFTTAPVIELT